MATGIVTNALTMNPIEVQDISKFIVEQIFTRPDLLAIHGIQTGVTMKEQIVFAALMGKTGLSKSAASCARQSSNPESVLSEKYWEPAGIEDTLIQCNATLDALFKAYYGKIKMYRENYEIEGSDLEIFFSILFLETVSATIWRAAWFGDTSVAAAAAGTEGLISADDVQYYNYFDGLFAQIFDAVTAGTVAKYTIASLPATDGTVKLYTPFESMWSLADRRLRGMPGLQMLVTGNIFDNYRSWLVSNSIAFELGATMDGLPMLKWNNIPVVDMSTVWDNSIEDFVTNTTDNDVLLPYRAVLTVKENIPLGTLNDTDFDNLEIFYDKVSRQTYMAYGLSLDAKLLEEKMIVVGYGG